jgi:PPM family protein phosphatase
MVRGFAQIDLTLEGWDGADHLRAAAFRGEDAIAEQVALRPELDGMATTLTAVFLQRDHRVVLLHAGDSRGYLFRDRRLYQLNKDDTFVQSLVDARALSPDEARLHPQRNIVLRALTGRDTRFSLASWTVRPGDLLLLCSDGLSDALSDDVIAEVMSSLSSTEECAERLIGQALSRGARDNVTCIVAHVVEGPPHIDLSSSAQPYLGAEARSQPRHSIKNRDRRHAPRLGVVFKCRAPLPGSRRTDRHTLRRCRHPVDRR